MMVINKNGWLAVISLLCVTASIPLVLAQENSGSAAAKVPGAEPVDGMVKMVFMLKRRPGMSRADFIQYYEGHHARLGEKYVPNAVRYVRRFLEPVPGPWTKAADEFDVITELWFANKQEADRAMAHLSEPAINQEIAVDEAKLFDRTRTRVYLITEHESVMPNAAK